MLNLVFVPDILRTNSLRLDLIIQQMFDETFNISLNNIRNSNPYIPVNENFYNITVNVFYW